VGSFQREIRTHLDSFGREPTGDEPMREQVYVGKQGPRRPDERVQDGDALFLVCAYDYKGAIENAAELFDKATAVEYKRDPGSEADPEEVWTWVVIEAESGRRLYNPTSKRNRKQPGLAWPEKVSLETVHNRAEVLGVPLREVD
jgi:hypothetical protein